MTNPTRDAEGEPDSTAAVPEGLQIQRSLAADAPISRVDQDSLGRAPSADALARQILALDTRHGAVVGVLGAWGAGKTSFVNLACHHFERSKVPVLEFNPWMFSGAEQLVERFFTETAAQLRVRPGLKEIAEELEEYGEVFSGLGWLPLIGPWFERWRAMSKFVARVAKRRREGVTARRKRLHNALKDLDKPIVVVVDDIDRLPSAEIRDVFKLVRLTASFPNLVYLLAFDRARVEGALSEQGVPGRDYLEKIIQVAVDLPVVPSETLRGELLTAIHGALDGIPEPGPFDKETWPDLFSEIVWPLVRHMRDVRRLAHAVRGTVESLQGKIALADVIALESVRTFQPDVFAKLGEAVEGLTTTSGLSAGRREDPPHLKAAVESLLSAAANHESVTRVMISRLFPAGARHIGGSNFGPDWKGRWLRERRVAHKDVLSLYLERVPGEGLRAFTDAEKAFSLMGDATALRSYLRSLDPGRLEDIIASLEGFEENFAPHQVVPTVSVLLNLAPDLPDRPRGMFDFGARMVVGRVVYRLLRSLPDPNAVHQAVRTILPDIGSLSAKLQLIDIVGHRENVGHGLISETDAAQLESDWRAEVRTASVADLLQEEDVFSVLLTAKRAATPDDSELEVPSDPRLTLAAVRTARTEVKSQTMGSHAVRRSPRLSWEALLEVFGSEARLREQLDAIPEQDREAEAELLALADKYLSGWRPNQLDDDWVEEKQT